MTVTPPLRVLLVDDHALFRKCVARLLATEPGFEVVGEATNGLEALGMARDLKPDVILMDVFMPQATGLEATRRILEALPSMRIVMLTMSDEDEILFEAMKCGARGFVLKETEPQVLFDTLRSVVQGEVSVSGAMAAKLMGEFSRQANRRASPTGRQANLSPRECEILALVAQGMSNKEIAAAFAIAENTVKNHLKSILEKLHLENRVQAATYALREGVVRTTPSQSL